MKFRASLGKSARIITVVISIVFVGILVGQVFFAQMEEPMATKLAVGLIPLIYLLVLGLSPRGYEVNREELVIRRLFGKVVIKRSSIVGLDIIQHKDISGAVRTFGVGGLFGYFGKFYNKQFGSMKWYATRLDTPVMITTIDNVKIVVSPDQPVRFGEALRS